MGGFFGYARNEYFPTQFPEGKTAVTVDVLETGFILAFLMILVCFYLVIPGFRGKYQAVITLRVTMSLLIGAILMTSNFGQAWEVGEITTKTPYKAGAVQEIKAKVGIKLGLRSVNVTLLQTDDDKKNNESPTEKIDYNERFWWTWDQGRFGFGPYAGELQQSFRQAQNRGLPLPIIWIVDYFITDGEGLRYGRHYRTAGWYAHIAMWAAFPCWLLANFLFLSVIRYGAYFTALTGALQLLACLLWVVIRNPNPLIIPFESDCITTKFGPNFWLTLIAGTVCVILGLVILFFDLRYPDEIAVFFGIDPLADYEEYHLTASELEVVRQKGKHPEIGMVEMNSPNISTSETTEPQTQYILKRRTTVRVAQKSLFRAPTVTITSEEDDDEVPLYLNIPRPGYSGTIPEEQSGSGENLYNP